MSSLKRSLIIIMVVLFPIRTIFAKHLCDYPFSDLPKQILAIGWLDLPEIYVVIAKDLTVYTIQMKDIDSHTKDTPISFVVLNETTLEDFWPKVYDNADFQSYKDGGFETPFWTEDKTITFVKSVDGATVVLVDGNSESLGTATFASEMDNPTDAYSEGHVWTQSVVIGYPNIPCVTFYQDEDNNHRFMRILYAYSQDHKHNKISVDQDFYMCKSKDGKQLVQSDKACGWQDDAILMVFFEQNDAHLFLLAESQVYVIEGAFYKDSSFYTMNYNKFFNCGHPESTTTSGDTNVSGITSGNETADRIRENSKDKSGFPTVAIIIIVLVLVAFLIAIIVIVVLYCFIQSQDKKKRSSRKSKTSSSGLKASKLSKGPNSKNKLTSRRLTSKGPTSKRPTSKGPTSKGPTSKGPTSKGPTSKGPTSKGPTSKGPTSKGPTSKGQTSKGPTSKGPTSKGPTSKGQTSKGGAFSKKTSKRSKVLDSKAPGSNLKGTSKGLSSTRRSNMKSKKKQSKAKTSRMQASKMKFSKRK